MKMSTVKCYACHSGTGGFARIYIVYNAPEIDKLLNAMYDEIRNHVLERLFKKCISRHIFIYSHPENVLSHHWVILKWRFTAQK